MKTYKEMCDELVIRKGDVITIKPGSEIYSTHPTGIKISTKTQRVIVHAVYPGYTDGRESRKAQVHWVGTGSYFRWTDIENVEELLNDYYRNTLFQNFCLKEINNEKV